MWRLKRVTGLLGRCRSVEDDHNDERNYNSSSAGCWFSCRAVVSWCNRKACAFAIIHIIMIVDRQAYNTLPKFTAVNQTLCSITTTRRRSRTRIANVTRRASDTECNEDRVKRRTSCGAVRIEWAQSPSRSASTCSTMRCYDPTTKPQMFSIYDYSRRTMRLQYAMLPIYWLLILRHTVDTQIKRNGLVKIRKTVGKYCVACPFKYCVA